VSASVVSVPAKNRSLSSRSICLTKKVNLDIFANRHSRKYVEFIYELFSTCRRRVFVPHLRLNRTDIR
jgi:hypothetical protein